MHASSERKQVNVRIGAALFRSMEAIAREERRSIPQTARRLLEEALRQRLGGRTDREDTQGREIAALAMAGGALDWLADEPDIYDDTCGEPL